MENMIPRRTLLTGAVGTLAAAAVLADTAPVLAQGRLRRRLQGEVEVDDDFTPLATRVGVNQQSPNGPALTDPSLEAITTEDAVDLFRFPGGTTANYWDWQKGWVIDDELLPASGQQFAGKHPIPWLLEDLAAYCTATGTTPIFVLNIATSELQYQLDMLAHAASLGLPISYVELGNEFYWGASADLFPTVADYAAKAAVWADAVKAIYPAAEIATVAWDGNSILGSGGRPGTWNAGMAPTLAASTSITAVAMHPYTFLNPIQTNYGQAKDLSKLDDQRQLMALGFDAHADTSATMDAEIPAGKKLWFTEYNFIDAKKLVMARWGQALFVATQALTLLEDPRARVSTFHSLFGAVNFAMNHQPAYDKVFAKLFGVTPVPWSLTAGGVGISEVFGALQGATAFKRVELDESVDLSIDVAGETRTFPSLLTTRFKHDGSTRTAVVLNLSDSATVVNLHPAAGGSATHWRQHWAQPDLVISDSANQVSVATGAVSSAVTLNPYSITVVY